MDGMGQRERRAERAVALGEVLTRDVTDAATRLHEAVAGRLGIGPTDLACLNLVRRGTEALTAGKLAELMGVTTGAITGVLDRLERAGFLVREKALEDRRQVLVRLAPGREREIDELLAPLSRAFARIGVGRRDEELDVVAEFLSGAVRAVRDEAARLGDRSPHATSAADDDKTLSTPMGSLEAATLDFSHGAWRISVGPDAGASLYRVTFESIAPKVTVRAGVVSLERPSVGLRSLLRVPEILRARERLEVRLNERVTWSVRFREGAADINLDLKRLELRSIELKGGASGVTMALPAPRGSVSLKFTGGASSLRITRPATAPIRLSLRGGASGVVIDTLRLGAVGGELKWESPSYEAAHDRYDLELSGGASDFSIGTF